MGLVETNTNEDYEDDSPLVPTGYYWGTFKSTNHYTKKGKNRVALQFEVEHEDDGGEAVTVEVPYFAPALVSSYAKAEGDVSSSKIGGVLEDLGLIEAFDKVVGAEGAIVDGEAKFQVESQDDEADLENALNVVFKGKEFYLNVKQDSRENDDGEEEETNLVSEIEDCRDAGSGEGDGSDSGADGSEDAEDSETVDSDDGDDENEAVFDDDESDEEASDGDGEERIVDNR